MNQENTMRNQMASSWALAVWLILALLLSEATMASEANDSKKDMSSAEDFGIMAPNEDDIQEWNENAESEYENYTTEPYSTKETPGIDFITASALMTLIYTIMNKRRFKKQF
jgi:hypothetical protein